MNKRPRQPRGGGAFPAGGRACARLRGRRPGLRRAAVLVGGLLWLGAGCTYGMRAQASSPEWSALGSLLLPGVGQAINGAYGSGAVQFWAYARLVGRGLRYQERADYIQPEDREVEQSKEWRINRSTLESDVALRLATDLRLFSAYDAYRIARARPENQQRYRTPAPADNFFDLLSAPYRPKYLFRLTSAVPILLAAAAAAEPPGPDSYVYRREGRLTRTQLQRGLYLQFSGVGLGEEAFFRGYLNTAFSDSWGERWGLVASSLAFGLAHSGDGGTAGPAVATLAGGYLGWLHQRNGYTLGQVVAIHTWWDILISYRATQKRQANVEIPLFRAHFRF